MVEILRPVQRPSATRDNENLGTIRPGAPAASFLAQLFAQEQMAELTTADVADRYETAAALNDEPHCMAVATI